MLDRCCECPAWNWSLADEWNPYHIRFCFLRREWRWAQEPACEIARAGRRQALEKMERARPWAAGASW